MDFNISNWKEYKIKDIFQCSTTNAVSFDEIIPGDRIYITRSGFNNGCSGFIKDNPKKLVRGNCITIGAEGKIAFYQKDDFLPGVKVYTLRCEKLNQQNALFIVTLLNLNCYKYSYGRARILENIKEETILLPSDKKGKPDWAFMSEYIENVENKDCEEYTAIKSSLETKNSSIDKLENREWKYFKLEELFSIGGSKTTKIDDLREIGKGKKPYVTTKAVNNGVDGFFNFATEKGHCLTIDSAVLGYCSYQEFDFSASDHVEILRPKFELSKYCALFLATILNKECYKFSYGRKRSQKQLAKEFIYLPCTDDGNPDFIFMENVIKKMPFADKI